MPEGPLGLPRITSVGPFVSGECNIAIQDSRLIKRRVEDRLRDKDILEGDEEDVVISNLERNFGDALGSGSGRMVFGLSDKCVLKVSKQHNPFQNKSEVLTYTEKLTESQKELFAPVIYWGGDYRWLTMRRSEREPTDEEFIEASRALVMDKGLDLIDFQKRNFGVIDGDTVLIDYGVGVSSIDASPEWDSREEAWEFIRDDMVFN